MTHLSYISSKPTTLIHGKTVIDLFNEKVEECPDKEIFIHRFPDGSRKAITYRELEKKSEKVALYLISKGIKVGDSVGMLGPNSIEWIIGEVAILMTGATAVHLTKHSRSFEETFESMQHSDCTALLVDPDNDSVYEESIETFHLKRSSNKQISTSKISRGPVIVFLKKYKESVLLDVNSIQKQEHLFKMDPLPKLNPKSNAIVLITSGSTGQPKMVEYTHFALVNTASACALSRSMDEGDVVNYNDKPFSWIGGNVIYSLIRGDTRVFRDGRLAVNSGDTVDLWKIIVEEKCTSGLFFPFAILDILQNEQELLKMKYLLKVICTGGQVIGENALGVLGKFCEKLIMLYGSTELGIVSHCVLDHKMTIGKLGSLFPGVEMKIVDDETRTTVTEQMGEIMVKCPWMSKGYRKAKEKDQNNFVDGWMKTGDIGMIMEDGTVIMKGKAANVIKRGTLKILSTDVEECISEISGVKEVVVVAIPDKSLYEEVCACLVLEKHSRAPLVEIESHCKKKLGDGLTGSAPSYFLVFESLLRLDTGKPDKVKMKEEAIMRIKDMSTST